MSGPWFPRQSQDHSGWDQLGHVGWGRQSNEDGQQANNSRRRRGIMPPPRPVSLIGLVILAVFLGKFAWDSSPWTRDQHIAIYHLLEAELTAFPPPYQWSTQVGRMDDRGDQGALDHGPYVELEYVITRGQCSDVQAYYAQAAASQGWSVKRHQDFGGETVNDYAKTVEGNALTLSIDCRDSDGYFEVWFNGS